MTNYKLDPILIPGVLVKRKSDGVLGTVELDPDGRYAVRIGQGRHYGMMGSGNCRPNTHSL